MKTKITTKTATYLNYSLSREEREILAKSNEILNQLFETIEAYTDNNMNDFNELIEYFNYVFNEDVETYNFTLCGIINAIINHSNISFIMAQEEDYSDEQSKVHK